jgi:oligoendopeptidase F
MQPENLASVKPNGNAKALARVFKEYGVHSQEFHDQIKGFIIFLQLRYDNNVDNDTINDCYMRLLEALTSYYQPGKNISTFCYTVIRNRIATLQYRRKKFNKQSFELKEEILETLSTAEKEEIERLDVEENNIYLNNSLRVLKINSCYSPEPVNQDSGIFRLISWEKKLCTRQPDRYSTKLKLTSVRK